MPLIRISALLSLCCTHSFAVYAQEVPPLSVEKLLSVANRELKGFAERAGYCLLKDRSSLSVPGATVAGTVAVVVATAGVIALAIAGVLVTPGATGISAVFNSSNVVTAAGIVFVAVDGFSPFTAHLGDHKVPFINHYRSQFDYVLADRTSGERIRGSCLYFFRMDESGYTLDIEIDNCSHDDIFPQEAVGTMRVGGSVDFFERNFSDQDEVVVSTNVPI